MGMNWFRNAYHHEQARAKREFHELVDNQLPSTFTRSSDTFKMHYRLYYKSKVCDASNVIALIEKFTLDALHSGGIIAEDNVQFHRGSSWEVVEQSKENPRVEITLTEIKESNDNGQK